MTMKITFLGSGSAFTSAPDNYQSNVLLEIGEDSLLIDAGTDIKRSLFEQNKTYHNIKNVFITHLHGDHAGGLEWLALTSYFDPNYQGKPNLILSEKMVNFLWDNILSGSLQTLATEHARLETYFNVKPIKSFAGFTWHGIKFTMVQSVHYFSEYELMPTYGLIFNYDKKRIYFTADTQSKPSQLHQFYEEADVIFHDCETANYKSGVHAHYSELLELPEHIKKKMWLYHYNPGPLPDAVKDGFLGFVKKGQSFDF